jgi:trehalose 6-phosphate synthase/phosphatase
MSRLILVSSRLPVTVARERGRITLTRSAGGLATGVGRLHESSDGVWFGWPGEVLEDDARQDVEKRLEDQRSAAVWMTAEEVNRWYEGFSNGVLWPLFHYLIDRVPLDAGDWEGYARVNERFADIIAAQHRPGDRIWIHDYQLMLLPRLLRERLPHASIGFFLHIPFPSSEVFRTLPFRAQLLNGLLGADLVGFHTASYMRHFASSVLRIVGLACDVDRLQVGSREVRLGVFPMGIDAHAFATLGDTSAVIAEARTMKQDGCALLVGVDRLDYTKGIPRRLLSFEKLLERRPDLRERVRLIQVAVPSRATVPRYETFRREVDALVGRVNGAFGTTNWVPIHYVHRSIPRRQLVALYRAADVMVVTPVRDGMNLVAKEFVAARTDGDGVLVLSEFAGSAAELAEAVQVNPYDVEGTSEAYERALFLPEVERRTRMAGLRERVLRHDVHHWMRTFLAALEAAAGRRGPDSVLTPPVELAAVLRRLRSAERLMLLLDYDGTLVPFASVPQLALPDPALLDLLRRLAARPRTTVHVVSGRPQETLERWLGELPIGLHAEHGLWSRAAGEQTWTMRPTPSLDWHPRVLPILEEVTARTPGSLVEIKRASLAWHYRMADPEFGAFQANELRLHLTEILSNVPVEILSGDKVIEIRPHGINKGVVVRVLAAIMPPGTTMVGLGDDRTDEDLFAALPPDAVVIHVGPGASGAGVRIADPAAARQLLTALVDEGADAPFQM